MDIKHGELKQLIKAGYNANCSLDVKGQPGIGKSEIIFDEAQKISDEEKREFIYWNNLDLNAKLELNKRGAKKVFIFADLRLSQFDQTDLKGFPKTEGTHAYWLPNLLFSILSDPEAKGLIFFDEMNLANPSVVASAYQIINDSKIGEMPISEGVYCISAGNGMEDTNNAFEDPAPLNNRRMNVTLLPPDFEREDGEDWFTWASTNGVDGRIISYHAAYSGTKLQVFNPTNKEKSFPSPRTWKKYSDMVKDNEDLKYVQLVGEAIVGPLAKEFVSFVKLSVNVNVDGIIKNPKTIEKYYRPDKISLLYSIVGAITEKYKQKPEILNQMLKITHHLKPEFGMFMLKMAKNMTKDKDTFVNRLLACSEWVKVSEDFQKYLL